MRTTFDTQRNVALFIHDADHYTMVECKACGQHQAVPDGHGKAEFCTNSDCGKELFYPGWAEW